MLRVAVPNKGSARRERPRDAARGRLPRRARRRASWSCSDPDNDAEFFFLRPRDIATYVGAGQLDVGITGRDLLLDCGAPADEVLELGFAPLDVPLRRAGRRGADASRTSTACASPPRTPGSLATHLAELGVDATRRAARRRGRERGAPRRRRRGRRRRRHRHHAARGRPRDRRRADPGSPRPCWSVAPARPRTPRSSSFVRRLEGVIVARSYVMMDYDITHRAASSRRARSRPGIESPTVSPLREEGWVAVRAMVPEPRRPPRHGRALGARRARHHRHRHPRLPAVSRDGGRPGATQRRASPFAGRALPDPGFAGDDGAADRRLDAVLAEFAGRRRHRPTTCSACSSTSASWCRSSRPRPTRTPTRQGLRHDKSTRHGDRDARRRRRPQGAARLRLDQRLTSGARTPPPWSRSTARRRRRAALDEGADAMLLDLGGPHPFVLEGALLRALAQGRPWVRPVEDADVRDGGRARRSRGRAGRRRSHRGRCGRRPPTSPCWSDAAHRRAGRGARRSLAGAGRRPARRERRRCSRPARDNGLDVRVLPTDLTCRRDTPQRLRARERSVVLTLGPRRSRLPRRYVMARKLVVEFIGTFILVFVAVGAAVFGFETRRHRRHRARVRPRPDGDGLRVRRISGCHVNPAVTIAMVAARRQKLGEGARYLVAQFAGAIAAAGVLQYLVDQLSPASGRPRPGGTSTADVLGSNSTDALGTGGTIVLEVIAHRDLRRRGHPGHDARSPAPGFAGLAIGVALAAVHLVGIAPRRHLGQPGPLASARRCSPAATALEPGLGVHRRAAHRRPGRGLPDAVAQRRRRRPRPPAQRRPRLIPHDPTRPPSAPAASAVGRRGPLPVVRRPGAW